ncbi:hypothetical protein AA0119_g13322 [Alternaria tenuissima]|jgi:hypothetical protein|uniref:Uncharacterized protein n=2 Tax=Alternaria alternata complex TaxID=187734 RepID=A0A4V1WPA2_ALTAL|nr:hypothetical protein AA0115_g13060 [Alternaria tenuissima]RYN24982.1 hypothetical protein AA0114_g12729 [Alternaria tenuissima]RYN59472.1 hypothetical protein AA0117_g13127 [Alternaria alternata]RYN85189.1 hypothetical protein AA0119_g13322 [Alternaria tenuissima]RYO01186.1 hypothetical protein AA0121_g13282 [Alternaria tenuissima]
MPAELLPASAAPFELRSSTSVVLDSKVQPWFKQTLKGAKQGHCPLNNVMQRTKFLKEVLSQSSAIWSLCSIMVPKAPDSELRKDPNPLVEALFNYQLIHIEAYVVYVDMVSQHEVAFKLTDETIEALVEYHKGIYSVDVSASTCEYAEREQQLEELKENFVQALNRFVFRTEVKALEELGEDGAGELLEGRGEHVKNAVMALFRPLHPPPPSVVYVNQPVPHVLAQIRSGCQHSGSQPPWIYGKGPMDGNCCQQGYQASIIEHEQHALQTRNLTFPYTFAAQSRGVMIGI